ncbi:MAG TPA: dihydrofolate reductase family protein [Paracoccaceae bacterium]|nr:dihydrofolate reductase family protein [Paracoccaceae bacterium]
MALIRGMMAASLDGYGADSDGGVGWLEPFHGVDWGFVDFLAQVGTVVMGRITYEQTLTLAPEWPYPGKRGIVLGQRLPRPLRGGAEAWSGDLTALVAHLRGLADGDVWVVGGPRLQADLIRLGALDRLELCVVPCLLGRGLPVFPAGDPPPVQPELAGVRALPMGLAMLDYRFGASGRGGRVR